MPQEESKERKKSSLGRKLLAIAATLVLVVLGAEAFIRLFVEVEQQVIFRDPVLGMRAARSFEGEVWANESQRPVLLRFHRDGFRGPDRPYEKPAGTRRIAVLGDSMIEAVATYEEATLVAQLEALLGETHPETTWEVMNFGVSSGSTASELIVYRELVREYDPDLVICAYFVGNDFADNSRELSFALRPYFDVDEDGELVQRPFSSARSTGSGWLNRNSRFYVWQKNFINRRLKQTEASGRESVHGANLVHLDANREDVAHGWLMTEELIRQVNADVVADGAEFMMVVIPGNRQLYDSRWELFLERYAEEAPHLDRDLPDRRLRAVFEEKGIPHLFLREPFEGHVAGRHHTDPEAQVTYGGGGHMNDRGQRLAAEAILRHLEAASLAGLGAGAPATR
jgi:hypothetical protein